MGVVSPFEIGLLREIRGRRLSPKTEPFNGAECQSLDMAAEAFYPLTATIPLAGGSNGSGREITVLRPISTRTSWCQSLGGKN
jgi:hypothetical protein